MNEKPMQTVLEAIGWTPMVRFQRVGAEFPVELYGKCEFLNPGGSVKDRISVAMIEAAEKSGKIRPGDTLVEATSGNTGIGLAMVAAIKGYELIICMPEKMSHEKQVTMEALGAKIIRTPTEAAHDDPESNFSVADRIVAENPRAHLIGQFCNPANPQAHYETTSVEILKQMEGRIDHCIMSIGTGGTLTGVGRRLREEAPSCEIVAVDPVGSIMGGGTERSPYHIEGIGYDFIPDTFDPQMPHRVIKTKDCDSFSTARRVIREEGLLVGGSSGAVVWAAMEVAKTAKPGARIVALLPDSIRNYMTKFLDDRWMTEKGFA